MSSFYQHALTNPQSILVQTVKILKIRLKYNIFVFKGLASVKVSLQSLQSGSTCQLSRLPLPWQTTVPNRTSPWSNSSFPTSTWCQTGTNIFRVARNCLVVHVVVAI